MLMALGKHPIQERRLVLLRRLRIAAVKVRFIGVVARVLRQQACENALVPFLEEHGLGDPLVVEYILGFYRSGGA